ncbi:hypothetical protein AVEN_147192-1, partial [Araneus ventricosus]
EGDKSFVWGSLGRGKYLEVAVTLEKSGREGERERGWVGLISDSVWREEKWGWIKAAVVRFGVSVNEMHKSIELKGWQSTQYPVDTDSNVFVSENTPLACLKDKVICEASLSNISKTGKTNVITSNNKTNVFTSDNNTNFKTNLTQRLQMVTKQTKLVSAAEQDETTSHRMTNWDHPTKSGIQ